MFKHDQHGRPILWYGLNGKPITDREADKLLRDGRHIICSTWLKDRRERVHVSTVFLVLDHSFMGAGPPVLWENHGVRRRPRRGAVPLRQPGNGAARPQNHMRNGPSHHRRAGLRSRAAAPHALRLRAPSGGGIRMINAISGDLIDRLNAPPSITCPQCGRTSYHPRDIQERYCGACHQFHDDMTDIRGRR